MIDANALMAKRMEEMAQKEEQEAYLDFPEEDYAPADGGDGFTPGLTAEQVEGLLGDMDFAGGPSGNVIKGNSGGNDFDEGSALEDSPEISHFMEEARQKAEEEAQQLLRDAKEQIAAEREEALRHAREQGYQEGSQRAQRELEAKQKELEAERQALEAEYDGILKEMEPKLVDAISDAYEYLIGEELSGYRSILMHMVSSAIRKSHSLCTFPAWTTLM